MGFVTCTFMKSNIGMHTSHNGPEEHTEKIHKLSHHTKPSSPTLFSRAKKLTFCSTLHFENYLEQSSQSGSNGRIRYLSRETKRQTSVSSSLRSIKPFPALCSYVVQGCHLRTERRRFCQRAQFV
ncbi:unnamed protein product [Leuciscus chuanchicus]